MAKATPTNQKLIIARVYVDEDGGFRIYVGKKARGDSPVVNGDYFRVEKNNQEKRITFTKIE